MNYKKGKGGIISDTADHIPPEDREEIAKALKEKKSYLLRFDDEPDSNGNVYAKGCIKNLPAGLKEDETGIYIKPTSE